MIFSGLVLAEAVPIWSKVASPAKSQSQFDSQALLGLLPTPPTTPISSTIPSYNGKFLDLTLPDNPNKLLDDLIRSSSMVGGSAQMYSFTPATPTNSAAIGDILLGVLPPIGSDLYYAYQDGGRAWYERGDNVLVLYADQTIHSFSKKTGKSTIWMQDRLAYPPINDAAAYTNYQKNYNAIIVAETNQWVLMEFPSGGLVKVMKPQYATTPVSNGAP